MNQTMIQTGEKENAPIRDAEVFNPPLQSATKSSMLVAMHIVRGRRANEKGKVAWVTSGAPVELLRAMDFYTHYPENHGAICGIALEAERISIEAENQGYSRDLCSYARTDIGSLLSGITPQKSIPRPDLLMASTNICQTVLHWYRILAHYYKVPLILIDTPFLYQQASDHTIAYVRRQIEDAVPQIEAVAGKALDLQKLRQVTGWSRKAVQLWKQVLECCRHRPAPISAFDQFILMAPIVVMRGEEKTVNVYTELLAEVEARITQGISVVQNERKRLLWDNLPIWYELPSLAAFLGQRGVVIAASTYTNAWAELADLMDPDDPFGSAAMAYLNP